jgi:hypothetical protein
MAHDPSPTVADESHGTSWRSVTPPTPVYLYNRSSEWDAMKKIDAEGDVIMVVGSSKREMRVNSNCLRLASPVFRSMLSPTWVEGQHLSKKASTYITLPEDDADAMETIFYVLHHRVKQIPPRLPLTHLESIAIVADKYDLTLSLQYVAAQWIRSLSTDFVAEKNDDTTLYTRGQLATAAAAFGLKDEFKICTRGLIFFTTHSHTWCSRTAWRRTRPCPCHSRQSVSLVRSRTLYLDVMVT